MTIAMAERTLIIKGHVAATDISFEDYLTAFEGEFAEWVDGVVIRMTPVSEQHDRVFQFLMLLLRAYLDVRPVGRLFVAPYVMKAAEDSPAREPDLQILLNENLDRNTGTYLKGPCDLAVEIISPESSDRDRGEKFGEYERAGVGEYWIVDPLRGEALFYRLGADGRYRRVPTGTGTEGTFLSEVLPGLRLSVDLLWREDLPSVAEVVQLVQEMTAW